MSDLFFLGHKFLFFFLFFLNVFLCFFGDFKTAIIFLFNTIMSQSKGPKLQNIRLHRKKQAWFDAVRIAVVPLAVVE